MVTTREQVGLNRELFKNNTDLAAFEAVLREIELEDLEAYRAGTAEAPLLYRPWGLSVLDGQKAVHDADGLMQFVASNENVDRMGDRIITKGWQLADFKKNPIFLWAHNASAPAIGAVRRIGIEDTDLVAGVEWAPTSFAQEIQSLYQNSFMRAVSVGFRALDFDIIQDEAGGFQGFEFKRQELLELSAVPVPANARALRKAYGEFALTVPDLSAAFKAAREAEGQSANGPVDGIYETALLELDVRVGATEARLDALEAEPKGSEHGEDDETVLPVEIADELADLAVLAAEKE